MKVFTIDFFPKSNATSCNTYSHDHIQLRIHVIFYFINIESYKAKQSLKRKKKSKNFNWEKNIIYYLSKVIQKLYKETQVLYME